MDRWDMIIILVASYVAIMALVRLMLVRRNLLIRQVREEFSQRKKKKRRPPKAEPGKDQDRDVA